MRKLPFTTAFLLRMYPPDACDALERLATFDKWAEWKQQAAYGRSWDPGDISQRDNANDYSPEAPEDERGREELLWDIRRMRNRGLLDGRG